MSNHRIEISFVGDAPESELERAKILGDPGVGKAIGELQAALSGLGLDAEVRAHSVRKMPYKARQQHMRVAGAQAAE